MSNFLKNILYINVVRIRWVLNPLSVNLFNYLHEYVWAYFFKANTYMSFENNSHKMYDKQFDLPPFQF